MQHHLVTSDSELAKLPAARLLYPFHLSTVVHSLDAARQFYKAILGQPELRATATSLHLDFFGSQLTLHEVAGYNARSYHMEVDAEIVPVPHFGAALPLETFQDAAQRLKKANHPFVLEPHVRFKDKPWEQWVLFILDPSGNAIEMKHFTKLPALTWT